MTDIITIKKDNGKSFEIKCSFQSAIMINGIEERIDVGDLILRKISTKYMDYIVTEVEYDGVGMGIMESTKISYSRPGKDLVNSNVSNSIGTVIVNGGIVSMLNSGSVSINQINQNNESIEKLIELIKQKDIIHKNEIMLLLQQYQQTQDVSKVKEIFDYIGNTSGLGQFVLAGFQAILS